MRTIVLLAASIALIASPCVAQRNPVTNGGFETLDADGIPVDWELLGDCQITEDAHSGQRAVLLQRTSDEGLCGLNRIWEPDGGEQGTMLSELKGGVRFWYKAEASSSATQALVMHVIPMSARPFEDAGEPRATFVAPADHVGDGEWHEGVLKYDFTENEDVKWVHIAPRVRGTGARLLLDDITWVAKVGPIPTFIKAEIEEVEGREGEECLVKAIIKNAGDQPIDVCIASIALPPGLSAQGGPTRNVRGLDVDGTAYLSWLVTGPRDDAGVMKLTLTAGDNKGSAVVEYAPELEVLGLFAHDSIMSLQAPTRVTLKLRNAGHAMVRGVSAALRPGLPLATSVVTRRQALDRIPPQTEASLTWDVTAGKQATAARVRVAVEAVNTEGGKAKTTLIVGAPAPTALPEGPVLGPDLADMCAVIDNGRVRLLFPKAAFGYGIGVLQRRVGEQWQTVGKLPRVSRLVIQTAEDEVVEYLVYADEAREIQSPEAIAEELLPRMLVLTAKLTDADGTSWVITETIGLEVGEDWFTIELAATPDRPAKLLALDGPMLHAGEGAPEGTRRLDAIFPGLEWLVEGEGSSNTLDIAADHKHRVRYVVHPHMVTIPLMCARFAPPEGQATTVALLWDHLQPYYGKLNRPSAVFASPDRFEGRAATVMGLFAPSMPEYIEPNDRTAHTPLEVAAGEPVVLSARLAALPSAPGETSLAAVKLWFRHNHAPAPNPLPHGDSLTEEIEFSMGGYLGPLWEEEDEGWWGSLNGPAIWHKTARRPAYLYDMRMCLETSENEAITEAVRERYDRVVELSRLTPSADDMGCHFAGPAAGLIGQGLGVAGLIRSQGEDGSWRFRARIETRGVFKGRDYSELGPDQAAAIGTCARNAWVVLRFARMTGDEQATKAGLKALAFMDRFRVPRAAQVWEVPFHTPDILASADACEAYLEGYEITGDREYLDKAVYWAWTGLPFVYMWDVDGFEFLKYGSIPVFGATWFRGSWFGRPVQWNGLRYAHALLQLDELDDSLDWAKVARGITVSCMYQQSTDEEDIALWPDWTSAIDGSKCGWLFAPRQILHNVYKFMGMQPTPVTASVPAGADKMRVTAAGKVSDVAFADGTLSCKVTYTPPQTGFVIVCNVSEPDEVRVNGEPAPSVLSPREGAAPCWCYIAHAGILELRLEGTGAHEIELSGVSYVPPAVTPETATEIAFEFDTTPEGWRPERDLTSPVVHEGVLHMQTTAGDPYLVRRNCEIAAADVTQLRIRIALEPGMSRGAQFFWSTADDAAMDEPKSQPFEVIADGEFHEALVSLADHELWEGTIIGLRIDPTGGEQTGEVRIDYVRGE